MLIRFFIIVALLFATEAYADIYKYVTEDGVECYTDTPARKDAVLVMREPVQRRRPGTGKTARTRRQVAESPKDHLAAGENPAAGTPVIAGNLPVSGTITSLVGLRHDPIDGLLRQHNGVDIAIPQGTPVKPVAAGIVVYSGYRSGYGNMIVVEHPDGMRTVYAHNSVNRVAAGEQIDRDSVIAFSGSTGRSTGPHVHFEAWKAGINITSSFLGYGSGEQLAGGLPETVHSRNYFRSALLPDGSLMFTNMP